MFCTECGCELRHKGKFCPECGHLVTKGGEGLSACHINPETNPLKRQMKSKYRQPWLIAGCCLISIGIISGVVYIFYQKGFGSRNNEANITNRARLDSLEAMLQDGDSLVSIWNDTADRANEDRLHEQSIIADFKSKSQDQVEPVKSLSANWLFEAAEIQNTAPCDCFGPSVTASKSEIQDGHKALNRIKVIDSQLAIQHSLLKGGAVPSNEQVTSDLKSDAKNIQTNFIIEAVISDAWQHNKNHSFIGEWVSLAPAGKDQVDWASMGLNANGTDVVGNSGADLGASLNASQSYEKSILDLGRLTQVAGGSVRDLTNKVLEQSLILWDHSVTNTLYGDVLGVFSKLQELVLEISALS